MFYRIDLDNVWSDDFPLSGPRFFALCHRVGAYEGVIQTRLANEREATSAAGGQPTRAAGTEDVKEAPAEVLIGQHSDLIEITRVSVEG